MFNHLESARSVNDKQCRRVLHTWGSRVFQKEPLDVSLNRWSRDCVTLMKGPCFTWGICLPDSSCPCWGLIKVSPSFLKKFHVTSIAKSTHFWHPQGQSNEQGGDYDTLTPRGRQQLHYYRKIHTCSTFSHTPTHAQIKSSNFKLNQFSSPFLFCFWHWQQLWNLYYVTFSYRI